MVRDALARLYDPVSLAAAPLVDELVERRILRSSRGLFDLLLAALERMRPPTPTPPRSQGWCCYRYLTLRYVEAQSHNQIARDLNLSIRQATRIHQKALEELTELLLSRESLAESAAATARRSPVDARTALSEAPLVGESPIRDADLTLVRGPQVEELVDVGDALESVVATMRPVASQRRVELQNSHSAKLTLILVNRVAFREILLNLALYLIGPVPRLPNDSRRSNGVLSLTVFPLAENGIIELVYRTSFRDQPYAQGSSLRDESLLNTARHLARRQNWPIETEVDFEKATVRIALPRRTDLRTILVLDDNPDVGALIQRILSGTPYQSIHLRTARRAVAYARDRRPDAVLLDVVLPHRDGWEVLAMLREDPLTASIPIVVCSILPDRELALALGAADFLPKPLARRPLLQTLDRLFPPSATP